jgi:hypothetical protein
VLPYGTGSKVDSWQNLCWFQLQENPQAADRVMDQLFLLAGIFGQRKVNSKLDGEATTTDLTRIESTIDQLWMDFQHEATSEHPSLTDSSGIPYDDNAMTALTVAYFMSARLMISMSRVSHLPDLDANAEEYSSCIL